MSGPKGELPGSPPKQVQAAPPLPPVDDFTHYFEATERLSRENTRLQAENERLRKMVSESIAARHQRHYQTCNCLGDKAICCDPACPCKAEHIDGSGEA